MPNPEHYRRLEKIYLAAPINIFFQPAIEIGEAFSRIEIPLKPEFHHSAHGVHGAVYFKALDDAAFFAANSMVADYFVLTASFAIALKRPASAGVFIARGWAQQESRRRWSGHSILSLDGVEIGRGKGTFVVSDLLLSNTLGFSPG